MRRGLAARRHVEPGDLREGDPRLDRLRRAARRAGRRGPRRPPDLRRDRDQGRPAGLRRAAPGLGRGRAAPTASSRSRSSPTLAHDTDGTLAQARDYWKRVDRPNLMIKIPGTDEGVPAIEQAIYEGINVNVTLLFSVEAYTTSPRHTSAGSSAASRRASRSTCTRWRASSSRAWTPRSTSAWTSWAARTCRAPPRSPTRAPPTALQGDLPRRAVRAAARRRRPVQRPLWASTGVKNPHYPETKYVDELVGPAHRQHDADAHAAGLRRALEITGATADQDPTRRAAGARRRRHRHGRRDRQAAARRHRPSSSSRSTS